MGGGGDRLNSQTRGQTQAFDPDELLATAE